MTIQQFQQLGELEKIGAVLEYGRLLAQNMQEEYRIFLYRLESFYVAMKYHHSNDQLKEIDTYSEVQQSTPHFRKRLISVHSPGRSLN